MKNKDNLVIGILVIFIILIGGIFGYALLQKKDVKEDEQFKSYTYHDYTYKLYVPKDIEAKEKAPLLVMLHGCTQNANLFAKATMMNEIAEREKFLVLYPEQSRESNSKSCWNWFNANNQVRGKGEPELIVGMINEVKIQYKVDEEKVFAVGLSAGGAMAVILGVTYPDVFQAIGVGAGLEYQAALNPFTASSVLENGGPNPNEQGKIAYQAMPDDTHVMKVIVFHGKIDQTVNKINGDQVISQWAQTNDYIDDGLDNDSVTDTPNNTIVEDGYTIATYVDSDNNIIMKQYLIDKMGHAWSGGSIESSYTDPSGPNESQIMWDFFMKN